MNIKTNCLAKGSIGTTSPPVITRGQNIVAFDDDPFFLNCLRNMTLHGKPLKVKTFNNPVEGLSWLEDHQEQVDMVISDLDMPQLNGMGVLRELSAMEFAGLVQPVSGFDVALMDAVMYFGKLLNLRILDPMSKPIAWKALCRKLDAVVPVTINDNKGPAIAKSEIKSAFANREFRFAYQPIVASDDGLTTGVEMLVRWNHPKHGVLVPGQFLSLINELNLMGELNKLALENAIDIKRSLCDRFPNLSVFVNITLDETGLGELIDHALEYATVRGVSTHRIVLEVTENSLVLEDKKFLEEMVKARLNGFQLALDDFGTGYTSFQWLDAVPFTHLKVDRDLVMRATTSTKYRARFKAAVDIARNSGLACIAEGVENDAAAELAHQLGCEMLQGWHYGKPGELTAIANNR